MNFFFSFFLAVSLILNFSNTFSKNLNQIVVSAKQPVKKDLIDILELPGTVLANESVQITTVVSEKIKKILFEEGKFAKKNQLLVELQDDEEQAIYKQVKAEFEEAKINYERALKLSEKGNISQSILDNRLMLKKKLSAKVQEIEAKIEDLKIKAPFNGFTSSRNFSEGALVKPGDIITNLYDLKKLKIEAYVPEIFSGKIDNKTNFEVKVNLKNTIKTKGMIYVIEPLVNETTRTFRIIGKIENLKNNIKPGMMVTLKIILDKKNALVVSEGAVFNKDDISYVYTVDKKNIINLKRVEIGLRNNGMVEVTKGISVEDLVVYEGINKINMGSVVKVK